MMPVSQSGEQTRSTERRRAHTPERSTFERSSYGHDSAHGTFSANAACRSRLLTSPTLLPGHTGAAHRRRQRSAARHAQRMPTQQSTQHQSPQSPAERSTAHRYRWQQADHEVPQSVTADTSARHTAPSCSTDARPQQRRSAVHTLVQRGHIPHTTSLRRGRDCSETS